MLIIFQCIPLLSAFFVPFNDNNKTRQVGLLDLLLQAIHKRKSKRVFGNEKSLSFYLKYCLYLTILIEKCYQLILGFEAQVEKLVIIIFLLTAEFFLFLCYYYPNNFKYNSIYHLDFCSYFLCFLFVFFKNRSQTISKTPKLYFRLYILYLLTCLLADNESK